MTEATMTLALSPDLASVLAKAADERGVAPEEMAIRILRDGLGVPARPLPRDAWEKGLLEAAVDCGTSLTNEAVSSDGLYD